MPYGLIPLIGSIALAIYFLMLDDTTLRARIAVAGVVTFSLVLWWNFPRWSLLATLLQVVVGIYVLLHLRLRRDTL